MGSENLLSMGGDALRFFAFTFVELTLLFVGISFLVGVINEFVPAEKTKTLLTAKRGRGYLVGAGLGALTPFCSCSTIPIMLGLLKAGAGFGPTMSFLFASPLVNPVIIGLFWVAFGLKATVVYAGLALVLAVAVSYLLDAAGFQRYIRADALGDAGTMACCEVQPAEDACCGTSEPERIEIQEAPAAAACCAVSASAAVAGPQVQTVALPAASCCGDSSEATSPGRWSRILAESVGQFRSFLPYIILGVAIGAFAHGFVPSDLIARHAGPGNPFAVPVAAFIGIPLYVRVSTMIPIGVALIGKGMSVGAVVALAIGGAGASIPEVVMLKRIFQAPILVAFLGSVLVIAVAAGTTFNLFF
jgi:uncharacterized membrane protein YraQ (UPF0718 family)